MGKAILTAILIFVLINGLVIMGLLGYGLLSGRFENEKCHQYLATWRGQKLVPPPPEIDEEQDVESRQEAADRIAKAEIENRRLSREMQVQEQLLKDMKVTLDAAREKIDKERQALVAQQNAFELQVRKYDEKIADANFQKALKLLSEMKAGNVKSDFMNMPDPDVVRYIAEMKTDVAKKILDQFKTPLELEKRRRIIKMLEDYKRIAVNGDEPSSDMTPKAM